MPAPAPYEAVDQHLVRVLPRLVSELGGDPVALMRHVGVSAKAFAPGAQSPTYRQAIDLVALASAQLDCDDFGMRLAMAQCGTIQSPLLRLIGAAATLGEALELVCAHSYAHSLAVKIWLSRTQEEDCVAYGLDILLDGVANWRPAIEQLLLIVYMSIRNVTGCRVRAQRILFRHEPISSSEVYRRYFGCEVKFGQKVDAILFAGRDLECPIFREGDDDVQSAIAAIERRFSQRLSPTHALVRGVLMNQLGGERHDIEDAAAKLGCSAKKLSRLLASEGTSFQAIKNKLRTELARYYLEETNLEFHIVSERLGFAEQSAFNHFCRKWLQASPTELRAAVRGRLNTIGES